MKEMRITEFLLERYVLGEISEQERSFVEGQMQSDSSIIKRIQEIKTSNQAILEQLPPSLMAHQISEKTRTLSLQEDGDSTQTSNPSLWKRIFKWSGIAAPILAASLFIFLFIPESTREKGLEPHLVIYQKLETSAKKIEAGTTLKENDVLQLAYIAGGYNYGVIFSIDGKGIITFHHPPHRGQSTRIESQKEHLLAQSYKLDDAPHFERFFLVTSSYPIPLKRVQNAAEKLSLKGQELTNLDLDLPHYMKQSSLLVLKQEH